MSEVTVPTGVTDAPDAESPSRRVGCAQRKLFFPDGHVTSKAPPEKKRKRKEVEFAWGAEQEKAMEKLKTVLSSAPVLKPLVYTPEDDGVMGEIVLGIDACGLGFGTILQQEDQESRRHPVR